MCLDCSQVGRPEAVCDSYCLVRPPLYSGLAVPTFLVLWIVVLVCHRPNPVYKILVDQYVNVPLPDWYFHYLRDNAPLEHWTDEGDLHQSLTLAHHIWYIILHILYK